MFVSFTKTLKKMSGFRLGFGVRVNKRNAPSEASVEPPKE